MLKQALQNVAIGSVDQVMALIPRRVPDAAALRKCKIVSHRGEHDNRMVKENTLLAFDNARTAGVCGLECDIRWTQDQVPVICHDASLERVFDLPLDLAARDFAELRKRAPAVPSLAEVVQRYGGDMHLMLEVKSLSSANLAAQRASLQAILGGLQPATDFHILALDPALFELVAFLPSRALLPVAELNVAALSKISLQHDYAGLAGHYLLLNQRIHRRHREAGQWIGTGFPRTRNAMLREIARGVEWIFSNDAVHLQRELDALRRSAVSNSPPVK